MNLSNNKVILLLLLYFLFIFQNSMTHHMKILSVSHTKNKLMKQYKSIHTKTIDDRDILKENKYFSELHGGELYIFIFYSSIIKVSILIYLFL